MTWLLLFVAGFLLFALLGGCSGLANRLILFPSHDARPTGAKRESLRVDAAPLAGRTVDFYTETFGGGAGDPDLYVLAFTGNAGRGEELSQVTGALLGPYLSQNRRLRFEVVALQYPGYGADREPASLAGNLAAARALYRVVRERAGTTPVLVYGVSLGTICALHLAANFGPSPGGPDALVLEKPPNLRSQIIWGHGWWNLWLVALPVAWGVPGEACSDSLAERARETPALFFIAEEDRVVPPAYSLEVAEAYGAPKRIVMTQGGHETLACQFPGREFMTGMRWLIDPLLERAPAAAAK